MRGLRRPPAETDHKKVEAEIRRIGGLGISALREEWAKVRRKPIPPGFTKDLLARTLIWRFQEGIYGGLDRETERLLDAYASGGRDEAKRLLRLMPGAEVVREYEGERHIVIISEAGFVWRGEVFQSLSQIARRITGTNWNGPRFFGLRQAQEVRHGAEKTGEGA